MADNLDFEKSLKELEAIVEKLEKGDCSLEESIGLFENGIKLTNDCKNALDKAQKRIISLADVENGD